MKGNCIVYDYADVHSTQKESEHLLYINYIIY